MNGRPVRGLDRPPGGRTERQVAAEVIVRFMEAGVIQRSPEQLAKFAEAVGIPVDTVRQAWNTRDRYGNAPPIDGQPVADGEQTNGSRSPTPSGSIEQLVSQAASLSGAKVKVAVDRVKKSIERSASSSIRSVRTRRNAPRWSGWRRSWQPRRRS
jgi:hypothetical protein